MCAKVGHPTLRLVRYAIEGLELGDLKVGELRELAAATIKNHLPIS